jgi:hypothetical protein
MLKTIRELLNYADLREFRLIEMTEVYLVDDDGRKSESVGFFRNPAVANAFVGNQVDADWHKTEFALVFTNGIDGFVVKEQEPVKIFVDEKEAVELRRKAITKLSAADREILGLGD